MQTCLLRPVPSVQRQSRRATKPVVDVSLGQPLPPVLPGCALFIGLAVHTDSLAVSLAPGRLRLLEKELAEKLDYGNFS